MPKKRAPNILFAVFLLLFAPGAVHAVQQGQTIRIYSDTYHIDRIYKSMQGPASDKLLKLTKDKTPGKLWITGFRARVVRASSPEPVSQEFMCHINLAFEAQKHIEIFEWNKNVTTRMFTLSQGQFAIDLPEGFGIPVSTYESFILTTQVLNHNLEDAALDIRYEVEIDYVKDRNLDKPLKPLFPANGFVVALLEGRDGYYGVENEPEWKQRWAHSHHGEHAPGIQSSLLNDGKERKFSGHWVVKPGREVRRTLVTKMLDIPFDTTIHYIAVHLHPFAESIELRDLTSRKTVWKAMAKAPQEGIGIEHVDYYSSVEGLPVYKDHDYEIISVYNNTSGVDQDAMATMFLYLLDKEELKASL